jgi:hypothetical protein
MFRHIVLLLTLRESKQQQWFVYSTLTLWVYNQEEMCLLRGTNESLNVIRIIFIL